MKHMMRMLFSVLLFQCPVLAQGLTARPAPAATFAASYVGDLVNVMAGGIQRGSAYLGVANLSFTFNAQEAGWWRSGMFFLHAAGTHGAVPSATLIGDLQVVSNIEAGNHSYLQELWYSHRWGRVEVIAGLQDYNLHFAQNEHSSVYLNSSFGVPPTISLNSQTSIFPLTSPGITVIWSSSEQVTLLAALFDGSPTTFDRNPHNLQWHLGSDDGAFIAMEAQYHRGGEDEDGLWYRFGAYRHSHRMDCDAEESEIDVNYGVYATLDRTLWRSGQGERLDFFARSSVCPGPRSMNPFFVGAGVNYHGLLVDAGQDWLGFAFAHAAMREGSSETTCEVTYQLPVTEHVTVQPDVQYIIHPAGSSNKGSTAVVGVVRMVVDF